MNSIKEFTLLPAAPNTCPECAVAHEADQPHNPQSLYYQMKFFKEHQRYPTWTDAMAHCSDFMRSRWRTELEKRGITFDE